jgi:integrase/recombinase XerC
MLPDLSDCTRLLDTFLAARNPRTLAAYQADLEDFRRFKETGSTYASTVGEAVQWLLSGPEDLANLRGDRYRWEMIKRGLQITTINRRLATLRSLVKLANTQGLVTGTLSVKNMPVPSYRDTYGPGRDGFRAMLEAAGAQPGPKGLRDVALLRLLHDLGLRRSEAVRLDIDDVDLPGNRIVIPGRGRAPRELVSLPEPTRAALAAWLEARGSEAGPLFVNFDRAGKGRRLTGAAVYHIIGWLGAKAGLAVRPQGLRHLAITTALDRTNGDMRAVAQFSRHKDLRILSRYRDNRPDLAGKVAALVATE